MKEQERTRVDGTPDCWTLLKVVSPEETLYKLFRGSYGGYLGADTWNINSGIVKYEDEGDAVVFTGFSGSRYRCWKTEGCERMTGLMSSVYYSFQKQIETENFPATLSVIAYEDFVKEFTPPLEHL